MTGERATQVPIAVVGVGALFPGSSDEGGFWRDLVAGSDLIRDVPPTHWLVEDYFDPDPAAPDKTYARRGAFLDPVPFDTLGFGVPPSALPATDTSQLLALVVAQRVLEEVERGRRGRLARERIGVILGVTSGQELLSSMASRLQRPVWVKALREAGLPESQVRQVCDRIAASYVPWQESTFPGLLGNVVAGRIANRFDLGGTNCVADAACASTFAAVAMAANELALGHADLVITGGVDTLNDIFMYLCFSKTPALSRSGDCRPFSDQADGTLLGEGLGMVALRRLADAEADGDRIYAVLRGVGSSSDGRARSVFAPRPEGQALALRRAYAAAGYGPETVELVEAHGTGTAAGDVAEFEALRAVFDATGRRDRQWCALGSVKSQIGHAKAAAGAAGLVKAVFALQHGVLPPTIKVARPNPQLDVASSPFALNTALRPWVRGAGHPRRASVSSFGFGGSNFHLALEEYRGPAPRALRRRAAPTELVLFAADSPRALAEQVRALEVGGAGFLPWLARTTQEGCRRGAPVRLAVVARDEGDLRDKLGAAADALERAAGGVETPDVYFGLGPADGGLAYLFAGQGSQYPGMGAGLASLWPQALAAWDLAAECAENEDSAPHRLVFPAPAFDEQERARQAERLRATERAQPALAATALAQLRLLQAAGVSPQCVGGHSFGELVALHAAGVFDAATLMRVAARRGRLMADAARRPGAMLAVRASAERAGALLAGDRDVVIANHNAPDQVVLSGPAEAIAALEARLAAAGIGGVRLPVATAFHSPVVAGAAEEFGRFLDGVAFLPGALPVYANAEAAPYPDDPAQMRRLLAGQLARPVRFVEQVEAMYADGVRTFVELGPGAVLSGLVARILAGRPHRAIHLDGGGTDAATAFHRGLARLYAAGSALDLGALWGEFLPTADPREAVRAPAAVAVSGTNCGKPYPPPGGAVALPPPNPEPVATSGPETGEPEGRGWLEAYRELQRETAEAHAAWQESTTRTHLAYLQSVERACEALSRATGEAPAAPAADPAPAAPVSAVPGRQPAQMPRPAVSRTLGALLEVIAGKTGYPVELLSPGMALEADLGVDSVKRVEILAALEERLPAAARVDASTLAGLRTIADIVACLAPADEGAATGPSGSAPEPASPVAEATAPADRVRLLLEVVAEKTGYPADMLTMQMALEADLGIDSIKRVEILSALEERLPGARSPDPAEVAGMRTLGDVLAQLGGRETAPGRAAGVAVAAAVTASEPAPEPARAAPGLVRRAIALAAAPPHGGGPGPLSGRSLVHVIGGGAIGTALAARLGERARVAELAPGDAEAVVDLSGLEGDGSAGAAAAATRRTLGTARSAAPAFAARGGVFVTVQDSGGDFGRGGGARAQLAGVAAVARTARREWPLASVVSIDLECGGRGPEEVAAVLAGELLAGGPPEVGLRADGARLVLEHAGVAERAAAAAGLLGDDPVVVASGGGRGITAACLVALARRCRGRFLLLGSTPLAAEPEGLAALTDEVSLTRALGSRGGHEAPAALAAAARAILAAREVRATLGALGAAGAEAIYEAVDVRDAAALARALAAGRARFGPATALVHGAGRLADKLLADKTDAQFDRVWGTKVEGIGALLEATARDPLRLIALFCSVAGRRGNAGQADYAAANEALAAIGAREARRRRGACAVLALDWGPWDGGMVTPALRSRLRAAGAGLIAPADGAEAFADAASTASAGFSELLIEAPPLEPPPVREPERAQAATMEVLVTARSHPFLADHAIEDVPVLPVVLALEWFARAARTARPGLELAACRDLRVVKGARLLRYDDGGDPFTVVCRARGEELELELRGAGGTLHYTAVAELARALPAAAAPVPPGGLERFPRERWYGDALFHGPQFQVIRAVEGISADGAVALLHGVRAAGWRGPWATDPAALDGGLQLAVLWSGHVSGGRSLPTGVGAYRAYRGAADGGELRCTVRGSVLPGGRALCDVAFATPGGDLAAELRGVELHRRPGAACGPPGL